MTTTPSSPVLGPTSDVVKPSRIRTQAAAMVVILLAQLLLGMANTFWLRLPDSGSGWGTAAPAALFMAHLILGTALLCNAVWIAIVAFRTRDRDWLTASTVGALGILLAFGAGSAFMSQTGNDVASYLMTIGTALAIAAYALGLYRLPASNT